MTRVNMVKHDITKVHKICSMTRIKMGTQDI